MLMRTSTAMQAHRNNIDIYFKAADYPSLQTMDLDKSLKLMVFCAGDNRGPQDIAFPHQSEIKVNTIEVKANLRGLKNKPGSTRPVDITTGDLLRLKPPNYNNRVEFTYALTTKAGLNTSQVSDKTPFFRHMFPSAVPSFRAAVSLGALLTLSPEVLSRPQPCQDRFC